MCAFGTTRWGWLLGIAGLCASVFSQNCAFAQQITPDGTLPNNSNIRLEGNSFNITGGTQAGSNLFHSFGQFSIPTGSTAFFNNTVDIQNIISRVTGGSISNIDGLIRANGTANLFLINPSGIVFGQNASLNVGGSFLASTASSFNFADGTTFSAIAPQITPLLTISVPIGLQFGQNPANIQVQGSRLQGAPNKTLGLVGGNLRLDNSIVQITGGRVELGSVGDSGTVGVNVNGSDLSLNFPDGIAKQDVSLSNRANVNVLAGGGGSIAINARNLNISGAGTEIRAGIASGLGLPQSKAGNIEINATEAIIDGSLVSNAIQANAVGQGSDIIIKTGSLKVSNGARIETSSFGQGNAGNLLIDAQGQVTFMNGGFGSTSLEATGVGNGGNLQIQAGSVLVTNNSQLRASTLGQGNSGNVIIDARDTAEVSNEGFIFSQVEPGGIGNGGETSITTGSLSVINGGILSASTLGKGDAGRINIEARDTASFNEVGRAFTTVEGQGMGNGNNLRIRARSLSVTDGSFLTANTLGRGNAGNVIIEAGESVLFDRGNATSSVEKGGIGNGGETRITTGSLSVVNGAILSASTAGEGDAGRINIEARDTASFNRGGGAFTTVEADGMGNGNDLRIRARSLSLTDGSFLTANTVGRGNAGNVIIEAGESVLFDRGTATSTVGLRDFAVAQGNGGTISISTGSLQLANQAQLLVNSYGREGNAGNIKINARDTVSFSNNSEIFSQLGGGIRGSAGNIDISTGSLQVKSGSIISSESFGNGNGGNITIKARDAVSFLTEAGAFSNVRFGAIGNSGDINITTGSLSTANGSFLAASILGTGNSGNVRITATDSISLEGVNRSGFAGGIYSEVATAEPGRGGNININTRSLTVRNGARLATDTNGRGDAGSINIDATDFVTFDDSGAYSLVFPGGIGNADDINITTRNLSLKNGAILTAGTLGQGNAGTINIKATDSVTISGTGSTRSSTFVGANTQIPGDIAVTSSNVTGIFVQSESTGRAGDIIVTSPKINLDNQGGLIAQSQSGNGGNIKLEVGDLLLLRRGSQISTTAGTAQQGGDGGNITINNAPNGFIVAVPNENSDISANAFRGQGGKVDITASGIYGIESRSRLTDLSDITASSELGVQGTINISTPNVDPNQGLLQLPAGLVNTPMLVSSSCAAFDKKGSEFIVTGRGGLPLSPDDFLSNDVVWTDTRLSAATPQNQSRTPAAKPGKPKAEVVEIVPATGWVFNGKGEVTLISSASEGTVFVSPPTCAK
jgi:filamentous hemagglutinin family protein